jgi:predicted 3-demethylubiquinone-9 3-methyltransferase (glyoxalase superfamily)
MMVNGVVINAKPGRRQASVGETEQTEMDTHTRVAIAISEALVKADMQVRVDWFEYSQRQARFQSIGYLRSHFRLQWQISLDLMRSPSEKSWSN